MISNRYRYLCRLEGDSAGTNKADLGTKRVESPHRRPAGDPGRAAISAARLAMISSRDTQRTRRLFGSSDACGRPHTCRHPTERNVIVARWSFHLDQHMSLPHAAKAGPPILGEKHLPFMPHQRSRVDTSFCPACARTAVQHRLALRAIPPILGPGGLRASSATRRRAHARRADPLRRRPDHTAPSISVFGKALLASRPKWPRTACPATCLYAVPTPAR